MEVLFTLIVGFHLPLRFLWHQTFFQIPTFFSRALYMPLLFLPYRWEPFFPPPMFPPGFRRELVTLQRFGQRFPIRWGSVSSVLN